MKLLILNYEYPPLGGGAGAVTKTIAEGLAEKGHVVTVVSTWFQGEDEILESGNLKIIRLKSKRKFTYRSNPAEMLSWILASKRFLKTYCPTHHFDLCLANFSIPGGETALYLKRRFNIPYIIISHGHDIPWFFAKQMFWYHVLTYFRIKRICTQSNRLVLLSKPMKLNADKFMGSRHRHKNCIIANGFDDGLFYPDYKKRNSEFTIVFSGRLVEQKDPIGFLHALHFLLATQLLSVPPRKFKVEIYGDGPLRVKMERYVEEYDMQETVSFKGWQNKQEIAEAYRKAHVFVSTSLQEGMSVAILEAMASGLYVFATPVSSNSEVLHDINSGEIIKCGDFETLSKKLESVYDEKFLKNYQIPEKMMEDFRNAYNNKVMVEGYDRLISGCFHAKK